MNTNNNATFEPNMNWIWILAAGFSPNLTSVSMHWKGDPYLDNQQKTHIFSLTHILREFHQTPWFTFWLMLLKDRQMWLPAEGNG